MCYSVCAIFCECVSLYVPQCCCVRQEARRHVVGRTFLCECVSLYVPFYVNVLLCVCRSAAVCGRKHGGMFSDVLT